VEQDPPLVIENRQASTLRNLTLDFTGRTVVITGASQGIGYEIAKAFLNAGANVAPLDRDETVLHEVWGESSSTILPIPVDVASAQAVADAIERIAAWSGSIDIVVNNAGITRDGVVWKMPVENWQAVLDVHLGGTFNTTRAAIPHMRARKFGRIVNVTSYSGLHGNVGQANYGAAKAGIVGFTKTVAKEVAGFGITVNAISPNAATAMVASVPPEKLAELTAAIPQKRFAEPAEMAAAVAFLASAEAAYITGAVLPVDGGLSM
jgi:3-oxoacyl-[acyl-carrier protein] reductase